MTSSHPDIPARGKAGIGAVVGMFDGVHLGHQFLIERLIEESARRDLTPGIFTFPRHPLSVIAPSKAPGLLTEPEEKLSLLANAGIPAKQVGFMVFDDTLRGMSAESFMRMLHDRYRVRFILRGFNNRFGTERSLTPGDYKRIASANGIELVDAASFCHKEESHGLPVSSSRIRHALAEGAIEEATLMLGRPYRISGTVVAGKHLGHTIGFPTANLRLPHSTKLTPADGVYICRAVINGQKFRAMVNIGTRPTIDGINRLRSIEAHIIDFDEDIYGQSMSLDFFHRMRPEKRFPSISELAHQLDSDRRVTLDYPMRF